MTTTGETFTTPRPVWSSNFDMSTFTVPGQAPLKEWIQRTLDATVPISVTFSPDEDDACRYDLLSSFSLTVSREPKLGFAVFISPDILATSSYLVHTNEGREPTSIFWNKTSCTLLHLHSSVKTLHWDHLSYLQIKDPSFVARRTFALPHSALPDPFRVRISPLSVDSGR
jgi:hypothetical protein